jgi:hypothetical protein
MVRRSSVLTGFYCTEKLDYLKRDSRNECVSISNLYEANNVSVPHYVS